MFSVDVVTLLEKSYATIKERLSSPPTCPGPQLLRFSAYVGADNSGKLDALATESYGSYNVVGCYGLFTHGKNALDNDWYSIDEILNVIKWIADGWYEGEEIGRFSVIGEPTKPFGKYTLEKRSSQIPEQKSEAFSELPRLIKISTSNTYSRDHPRAYIPIQIDTRVMKTPNGIHRPEVLTIGSTC